MMRKRTAIALLLSLGTMTLCLQAEPRPLREARSENRRYRFEISPGKPSDSRRAVGTLFDREAGREGTALWDSELVNEIAPGTVAIEDNARWIVTFDEFRLGGARHALVIYDADGHLTREFELRELLPKADWNHIKRRGRADEWLPGAKIEFPKADTLEVTLRWGTVLSIDLRRGMAEAHSKAKDESDAENESADDAGEAVPGDENDVASEDQIAALDDLLADSDIWERPMSAALLEALRADGLFSDDEWERIAALLEENSDTLLFGALEESGIGEERLLEIARRLDDDTQVSIADAAAPTDAAPLTTATVFEASGDGIESNDAAPLDPLDSDAFRQGLATAIGDAIGRSIADSVAREVAREALLDWVPNPAGESLDAGLPVPMPDPKNPANYLQWYKDYIAHGDPAAVQLFSKAVARFHSFDADIDLFEDARSGAEHAIRDSAIETWLDANRGAIEEWLEGARLDYRGMPTDAAEGSLAGVMLPALSQFREISKGAIVDGWHEFRDGNIEGGVGRVLDTLQAGATVSYGSTLVENLVGVAIQSHAHEALLDMFDEGRDQLDFASLAERVQADYAPTRPGFEALQLDRAMTLDIIQRAFSHNDDLGEYQLAPGSAYALAEHFSLMGTNADFNAFNLLSWHQRGFESLAAEANSNYDALTRALQNSYPEATKQLREFAAPKTGSGDVSRDPLISAMTPSMESWLRVHTRAEASRRATSLVANLLAYRQVHGVFPDSLDAVTFQGDNSDPFTGQDFSYRREGADFALSSAWGSGQDSGEDKRVYWPRQPRN